MAQSVKPARRRDREGSGARDRRKAVTRQGILMAGRRLFSERGLHESRVEEITRRAGIAKGTLYQYFRDKDDLILSVAASAFEELGQEMDWRAASALTLADCAGRIAEAHLVFFSRHPDLVGVLHQIRGILKLNRGGKRPLRALLSAHLDRIAGLLGRLPRSERLSLARGRAMAELIFGAISGAISVRQAAHRRSDPPAEWQDLRQAILGMAGSLARQATRSSARRPHGKAAPGLPPDRREARGRANTGAPSPGASPTSPLRPSGGAVKGLRTGTLGKRP